MVKIEESEKKRSKKIEKDRKKYETLFFGLNGGIEGILAAAKEDLKIEEEIQNKWHGERRVLTTLDWKRKQRFAVSQRKKENQISMKRKILVFFDSLKG